MMELNITKECATDFLSGEFAKCLKKVGGKLVFSGLVKFRILGSEDQRHRNKKGVKSAFDPY